MQRHTRASASQLIRLLLLPDAPLLHLLLHLHLLLPLLLLLLLLLLLHLLSGWLGARGWRGWHRRLRAGLDPAAGGKAPRVRVVEKPLRLHAA